MLQQFETSESTRAFFRPTGTFSPGQLVDAIKSALELALGLDRREMLVNISDATGFESPGPAFRRWAVRRWAGVGSNLCVAMVARNEHICPSKTGLIVAAEEGLDAHICVTEAEALRWLDEASHDRRKARVRNASGPVT